jgi:hypothetical protein
MARETTLERTTTTMDSRVVGRFRVELARRVIEGRHVAEAAADAIAVVGVIIDRAKPWIFGAVRPSCKTGGEGGAERLS